MRFNILLALLIITTFSCSKDKDTKIVVKYEVQGTSPEGYEAEYTNELGQTTSKRVFSGWSIEVIGEKDKCYTLTIMPYASCDWTGTINIFFDDKIRASKFVSSFTESIPNQMGRLNCGMTQTACH